MDPKKKGSPGFSRVNEPAQKKSRIATSGTDLMAVDADEFTLHQLLELVSHTPQLIGEIAVLRSMYIEDVTVEGGWREWLLSVLNLESNERRCEMLETIFSVLPELSSRKAAGTDHVHPAELYPLHFIVSEWPEDEILPIPLLDLIHAGDPSAVNRNASTYFGGCVMGRALDCASMNRSDVMLWFLRKRVFLQYNDLRGDDLADVLLQGFSNDVVVAFGAKLMEHRPERAAKEEITRAWMKAMENTSYINCEANEGTLRYLWKHSELNINLGLRLPAWLRRLAASEAVKESKVSVKWCGPSHDISLILPMLHALEQSTALTELILTSNDDTLEFESALSDVLSHCSSLKILRFDGDVRDSVLNGLVPAMKNLDVVDIAWIKVDPNALGLLVSSVKELLLRFCLIEPASEETEPSSPADCLEGLVKGLLQNDCIESIHINELTVSGLLVPATSLASAIASRPKLKMLSLTSDCEEEGDEYISIDLDVDHLEQLGMTDSLETLDIEEIPPGGLKAMLRSRPRSLSEILTSDAELTKEDFIELLEFLSDAKCKLERIVLGILRFDFNPDSVNSTDDQRLQDPISSILGVMRNSNTSLKRGVDFNPPATYGQHADEFWFWCRINRSCPNRLELRRELSGTFAYQIARYAKNERTYSEVFELLRTTFHLWLEGR